MEARVRAYAKRHGITPTELARRLGYKGKSRSWGSVFLDGPGPGSKRITPKRLDRVAALMGVSVDALFTGQEQALSPEAVAVATAYDACDSEQTRTIVRVALNLCVGEEPVSTRASSSRRAGRGR